MSGLIGSLGSECQHCALCGLVFMLRGKGVKCYLPVPFVALGVLSENVNSMGHTPR